MKMTRTLFEKAQSWTPSATDTLDSKTEPLIQLADLMAGAIKMELKGYAKLLNIIEEKIIEIRCFPINRNLDLSISVL